MIAQDASTTIPDPIVTTPIGFAPADLHPGLFLIVELCSEEYETEPAAGASKSGALVQTHRSAKGAARENPLVKWRVVEMIDVLESDRGFATAGVGSILGDVRPPKRLT